MKDLADGALALPLAISAYWQGAPAHFLKCLGACSPGSRWLGHCTSLLPRPSSFVNIRRKRFSNGSP